VVGFCGCGGGGGGDLMKGCSACMSSSLKGSLLLQIFIVVAILLVSYFSIKLKLFLFNSQEQIQIKGKMRLIELSSPVKIKTTKTQKIKERKYVNPNQTLRDQKSALLVDSFKKSNKKNEDLGRYKGLELDGRNNGSTD
jgi:hypothetical protein